jgi:hypothetical protein
MSLLLAGLVFAGTSGALFVGRWIARRRKASESDVETKDPSESSEEKTDADEEQGRAEVESDVPTRKDDSSPKAPPAEGADAAARAKRRARDIPKGAQPRLDNARFVCQLGDVIMRHTGEEAWLAGGLVLSEQLPVAILFVAPDVGHDCGIYVRTRPKDSLWWLEQLDPTAVLVGGEPPSSVEHGGIRFERARRLPLRPRRIGVGAPDVGDAVVVAEYSSAGSERLLVLKANSGVVRAYRGLELEEGSFEVIASGSSTLDG